MGIIFLVLVVNTLAFFIGGGILHWAYYVRRRDEAATWKHQPTRYQSVRMMVSKVPLVLFNSCVINGALGVCTYLILEGKCKAFWDPGSVSVPYLIGSSLGVFLWYHVMLYYWHRTMHRPALFRRIHHVHHKFKHPVWLDALYEHPIEAFWGAFVLITPLFVFPIWAPVYFAFMVIMGIHEVLDHAGININVPLLATSRAHDIHHYRCHYYFGQLLPLLDDLHQTVYDESNPRRR